MPVSRYAPRSSRSALPAVLPVRHVQSHQRKGKTLMSAEPAGSVSSQGLERRHLLDALTRLKRGDFSVRLARARPGVDGRIAQAFKDVVELNQHMSLELARLSPLV